MGLFLQQIFLLLTTPPGSLAYHLVLAFSVAGAFQIAVNAWRRDDLAQARRLLLGLTLLLLLQMAQFIMAVLAWQEILPAHSVLPPVDRSVGLLGLLVITWLWMCSKPARMLDAAAVLLGLLLVTFFTFSMIWWNSQPAELAYNDTWLDYAGHLIAAGLAAVGALILLLRRPDGWGFGLGMLGLLFFGYLMQALLILPGDYAGAARLFQMAAYPLLLLLPQPVYREEPAVKQAEPPAAVANRAQALELTLIQEFSRFLIEPNLDNICQKLTRMISQSMLADYCMLITPPDADNQMTVSCAYNLIQERHIEGFNLDGRASPMITNSMKRGRPVRITSANDSPEAYGLARGLGIKRLGHLMHVPIVLRGSPAMLGILLISPYSNRAWTPDDQLALMRASEVLAYILTRIQSANEGSSEVDRLREVVQEAQMSKDQAWQEVKDQQSKLAVLQQQLLDAQSRVESLAALVASHESSPATVTPQIVLEMPNQVMPAAPVEPAVPLDEFKYMEEQLHLALLDVAALQGALARADQEMLRAKEHSEPDQPVEVGGSQSDEQAEVVASMAQELRQPMSSIVGYTDLLLGESVGLLGATQRKFLERVKASVERMGGLVDDLIQVTTLQGNEMELSPELVDLNTIVDDAVATSIARLREKNIMLRMDLPERLPLIQADRDALQQVLQHLLQNAGDATPVEGEILLHAHIEQKDNQQGYILVQVSDSGGGIPPSDLPRVFSRLYRADNPLIQGVGDTGVGLSIVKALVEAHGGRVWVDSVMGVGSTFSVLLPTSDGQVIEQEAGGA